MKQFQLRCSHHQHHRHYHHHHHPDHHDHRQGGAVPVAVLYGLPAERGAAKSKGDDRDFDDHFCENDDD